MNRILLFVFSFILLGALQAQTFKDDMEKYNVDDYIAASDATWTVWSGANGEGTDEDALITNENAHSGKNSIRLEAGSAAGGPTDLVLPFGGELNVGTFKYEMWIFTVADQASYFNFQAKAKIGTTWALDNYFDGDAKFRCSLGSASAENLVEVDYAPDTWVKYTLIANLTDNVWEILLNDVSVIKFANPNNSIASIDIYPNYITGSNTRGSGSLFYVDDVSFELIPFVKPNLDAAVLNINYKPKFISGANGAGSINVRNLGITPITSIEVSTRVNGGTPTTTTISNLNIPSLGFSLVKLPAYLYTAGKSTMEIEISKVNGTADDNAANNIKSLDLLGVVPAPDKKVVVEEATGTWCQWCPRGAVYLDSMARTYPDYFIGIAVHGGSTTEPMMVPTYATGITTFPGFSGYPSIINDRKTLSDPLAVETEFYNLITEPNPAKLTNGARWDSVKRELVISVRADFNSDLTGDYRFNMVIVENAVKGTGTPYNQANAYAGNANGPMGGYELLTNPVPASKMTYNHVARAILDGYAGIPGFLSSTIKKGSSYFINYTYIVPANFKVQNIKLVGLLYGPNGEIINGTETSIAEAVANGIVLDVDQTIEPSTVIELSPNPSSDISLVQLELAKPSIVTMEVNDLVGKTISHKSYGQLDGNVELPIQTNLLPTGTYLIKLSINGAIQTKKLVVSH